MHINRLRLYINFAIQRIKRERDDQSRDVIEVLRATVKHAPDTLVLGDSVLERVANHDRDRRSLAQMIIEMMPDDTRTECISYSAYHIGVFYLLMQAFSVMNFTPSLLIIPINMRSFSPQWHLNPLFRCQQHIQILKKFIGSELHSIVPDLYGADHSVGIREFFNTSTTQPFSSYNKVSDFLDIINTVPTTTAERNWRFKNLFIYHYLLPLSSDHPNLHILSDFLKLADKCNFKVLLYTTPVNFEGGVQYVGEVFMEQLLTNVRVVKESLAASSNSSALRGQSFTFCDFSVSLDCSHFFNPHESTEHLNESGRNILAGMIAKNTEGFH